jgi:hypothetical protein
MIVISPELFLGPNKLEYLSLAILSSLVKCNTAAYWAYSWVMKDMTRCENNPIEPCQLKRSSLLYKSVHFATNKFLGHWSELWLGKSRHDTQQSDTQHNDI